MSYFEKGYDIAPGAYRFTLNVNGDFFNVGTYEVREHEGILQPVFHAKDLKALPLKEDVLKKLVQLDDNDEVFPLSSKVEGANTDVHANEMKIDISIPQILVADDGEWVDIASQICGTMVKQALL